MDMATRNYISDLAQQVINAYGISIPVDIENLVRVMGGNIREEVRFDDWCDGTIMKNGDNSFQIVVSPFQNAQRKKFTIAHELGHLFLHMGFRTNKEIWEKQDSTIYKRFGTTEQEYQANEFAASLLMPKDIYKRIIDEYSINNRVDITRVSDYFKVSVAAATNRGMFLGYLV